MESAEASGLMACRRLALRLCASPATPCASDLQPPRGGEPSPSPPCRPRLGGVLARRRYPISPGDPPRTHRTAPWTHKIAPWTHKTAPWTHRTGSRAQNCSLDIQLMRKIIAKYVQIPFFHKKSKIHWFLINLFKIDPGDYAVTQGPSGVSRTGF